MIVLDKISISYNNKNNILSDFSYCFLDTGLYVIVGKSGIGKTSLLNAIAKIIPIKDGEIYYSQDIAQLGNSLSYIFQDNNLLDELTIEQNIKVSLNLINQKYNQKETINLLTKLNLAQYLKTKVKDLSGGERQRVCIAIAILKKSKVILADEPSSSLDEDNAKIVLDLLKDLSKSSLIILSTHNPNIIDDYADYVIDLNKNNDSTIQYSSSLVKPKRNSYNLKAKNMFAIHFNVMRTKLISHIFTFGLFTILLLAIGFMFSLSLYSNETMLKDYFITHDFPIYAEGQDLENHFQNIPYNKIYHQLCIGDDFYTTEEREDIKYYNSPLFKNVIINNDLANGEIIITDYAAYFLKSIKILNFNDLLDCRNEGLKYIVDKYYNENNEYVALLYNLKIKDVIDTGFKDYYNVFEFNDFKSNDNNNEFIMSTFICNSETLYNMFYYKTECNDLSFRDVVIFEDSNLKDNEIIIENKAALSALEEMFGLSLEIGMRVQLELKSDSFPNYKEISTFIIKEIKNNTNMLTPCISISEERSIELFKKMFIDEPNCRLCGLYFTDESVNENVESFISVEQGINLNYYKKDELSNANLMVLQIKNLSKMIVVAIIFIASLILVYISYNTNKENRNAFNILELYGMKKINELLFISINNFILFLFSFLVASISLYVVNNWYDSYLEIQNNIDNLLTTYNFKAMAISFGIVIIITIIIELVGFLLILKFKPKTYINKM